MAKNGKLDAHDLDDADASARFLTRCRGPFIATAIVGWARWVQAGGPEALEQAFAPGHVSLSLVHPDKAKALKAARAMLAIPGKVWDELGVSFSFNTIAPALSALVKTLEREPARPRGRREGPGRFARRMLEFGAGELGALGLEQLTKDELVAAAVASGAYPGVLMAKRGTDVRSMVDSWRHHYDQQLPSDPAALAHAAGARLGPEKIERMRELIGSAAAA
jgi:hypothetical protein